MSEELGEVILELPQHDLRDLFAAHALQGMLAREPVGLEAADWIAQRAYGFADAMLIEREKNQ